MSIANLVSAVNSVKVTTDSGKSIANRFMEVIRFYKVTEESLKTGKSMKLNLPGFSISVSATATENRTIALAIVCKLIATCSATSDEKSAFMNLIPLFVVHEGMYARTGQQNKKDKVHTAYTNDTESILGYLNLPDVATAEVSESSDAKEESEELVNA